MSKARLRGLRKKIGKILIDVPTCLRYSMCGNDWKLKALDIGTTYLSRQLKINKIKSLKKKAVFGLKNIIREWFSKKGKVK